MPSDIRAAGDASTNYLSRVVKADKSPRVVDLVTDTTFLQVLVNGRMRLLLYHDEFKKPHFYIMQEDGSTMELAQHIVERANASGVTRQTSPYYVGTFKSTFPTCVSLHGETEKTPYQSSSLTALFSKYYNCRYGETPQVVRSKGIRSNWGILGGPSSVQMSFPQYEVIGNSVFTFPSSVVATGGIVLEFHSTRAQERFVFRNELMYRAVSSTSDTLKGTNGPFQISSVASVSFSHIRYNALGRLYLSHDKVRPFINGGISFSVVLSTSNQLTSRAQIGNNAPSITTTEGFLGSTNSTEFGFIGSAGIDSDKYGAEMRYEYSAGLQPTVSSKSPVTALSLLLTYRFNKK